MQLSIRIRWGFRSIVGASPKVLSFEFLLGKQRTEKTLLVHRRNAVSTLRNLCILACFFGKPKQRTDGENFVGK